MRFAVIISHKQSDYIGKFVDTLSIELSRMVFVFDAMDESDIATVNKHSVSFVTVPTAGNRAANRNAGLKFLETKYELADGDVVEFYDGDRIPVSVMDWNADWSHDVDLFTCEIDKRLEKLAIGPVSTGTLCNPFYSCGFSMKVSAIRKVEMVNNGNLFDDSFAGWGCEDQFLGLQCAKLNLSVRLSDRVVLAGAVGGDEISHRNYKDSLQHYVNRAISAGLFPFVRK